jgi:RHS repeat-associated protein
VVAPANPNVTGDANADRSRLNAPQISLPKGGGAIRGIGEKFAANPVTGTGSMAVPIATSPGRSGFGPQLSLSYDSGAGNGPFGFGWSLSLPSITRKTDKGLPQYQDAADSDVFILSGAEDLVPVLVQDANGKWVEQDLPPRTVDGKTYRVRRYRPRIEGLFARIERWSKIGSPSDVHWRSISRDNILTLYGFDADSRIADPLDRSRIFSWLICETRDDKGNAVLYRYKREDGLGVDLGNAHERNRGSRDDDGRKANRYLKRIHYGNRTSLLNPVTGQRPRILTQAQIDGAGWMFEVVFDYGEHDAKAPTPDDAGVWPVRSDPFSSYRAGFEVRTTRLCRRVLMFHHIPDLATGKKGYDGLVRSTDFNYPEELDATNPNRIDPISVERPIYTFLKAVTQTGYRRNTGGYDPPRSLPPVEFRYTEPIVQDAVEEVDPESLENLLIGMDGSAYRWTDLHGEGIPGVLTEQGGAWYYKRNWSPIPTRLPDGGDVVKATLAPVETVALTPNVALSGGAEFMDLAGDGQPDVVVMEGPMSGLYEHDDAEGWQPFRPFASRLIRDFSDPNLKFVDLDGDGHADVLITENDALVWHASLAEEGFGPARRVAKALDEEKGPRIVFADGTQSIHLADLSGDGLTDIVRIRNGEVCYWPNLGYCRFGAKVTMDNAPWFDHVDQFDPKRIRLADIDGSGTTDIIYLRGDGVRLYFNQSGNSWSQPKPLDVFPRVDDLASIIPIDLLGNGTACLVWSSPLPGDARRPMRYVNLMGKHKPHLLIKTINNLGAETVVEYAPSTKFYLLDKRAGKPWITRLPFPVHVVERVETYDHISRNRFATRYAYHHGYFDGDEREFRGFGMVEQRDTEEFATLDASRHFPSGTNVDVSSHVPPVVTKTWFHSGVYLGRSHVSDFFAGLLDANDIGEYYREPAWRHDHIEAREHLLDDTVLPAGLSLDEEREACRALRGSMLRQEIYALDGTGTEEYPYGHPYTVTEQNFTIRALQLRDANRHAVFLTHAREAINYHYERNPADPRVQHALTLEVDDYGNVLEQAAVGYGRRRPDASLPTDDDRDKQALVHITYTENAVTNAIADPADHYRTPLPAESRTYELRKPQQEESTGGFTKFYRFDDLRRYVGQAADGSHDIPYEDFVFARAQQAAAIHPAEADKYFRRLIEHVRTLYRPDDCGATQNDPLALLALEKLEELALPGESYKLAFTPGLLDKVFQRPHRGQPDEPLLSDPSAVLGGQAGNRGGYLQSQVLKADGRFPASDADDHWWIPSGRSFYSASPATELTQARAHFFLPRRYRDPFGNQATVDFDRPADSTQPPYDLLVVETRDALGNRVTVEANDYRVLQPRLVSDPNGNQTEVAFDTLGMVVGTFVMGKPTDNPPLGDKLDTSFLPDPPQAWIDAFIEKPREATANPKISLATQAAHDLLGNATTRIVYDLDAFRRTRKAHPRDPGKWEPPFAATIARETHVSDLADGQKPKLQISFSYSDGFGREIQKKIQAEPGPLVEGGPTISPRCVGSGWTIFNDKGKPFRQYEPFFSVTHRFEFNAIHGVSPVLFYDPAERVVATLHPNHTYEKVVFDPWQQTTYDVNDTIKPSRAGTRPFDPSDDIDVGQYFRRLSDADYLPTWYDQRTDPAKAQVAWPDTDALGRPLPDNAQRRASEKDAAEKGAAHADTPTTTHLDALGRPFLTVAHNRVVCQGHALDGKPDEDFRTRVELDIEGNEREVHDERKLPDVNGLPLGTLEQRVVMRYDYDMLGNRICQHSMEAGARWMLKDVAGKPIRAWDSRGHNFTTTYDALRRPVGQYILGTMAQSDDRTVNSPNATGLLVDVIEYGEPPGAASQADKDRAQRLNLRTRVYRHFDSAGVATNARLDGNGHPLEAYDFKGNLLRSTRRLATQYKEIPDWSRNPQPQLDTERFESSTLYDALNRPIQSVAPHSSLTRTGRPKTFNVVQPVFNEANLLERLHVWLERASQPSGQLDPSAETPSPVGVTDIDYDAKGQRLRIDYKNGAATLYDYDRETFRLAHLLTRRDAGTFPGDCPQPPPVGWPGCQVQNLHYTYDPAGNITHIRDDAQQAIYFKNKYVQPSNDYVYDALYRLIQAKGREHLGQVGEPIPHSYNDAGRVGVLSANPPGRFAPNDRSAMDTYTERYVYDAVGNFLQMQHRGNDPAHAPWTRAYDYAEASLIEDGIGGVPRKTSNRLTGTAVAPTGNTPQTEPYEHDVHGNMIHMPHLKTGPAGTRPQNMFWDYKDQLRQVGLGGGGTAFCVYDASGQRVRKVCEKNGGTLIEERIYLGGFEIFRKHGGPIGANPPTLERETLHVMDDTQRIALIETRTLGNDSALQQLIRYQFGNHIGSASLELNDQTEIISYEEYSPYGSSTYQAVRSQTETAKRYRYTGKERDEESGFYYHGARYYAAWLGRWVSADPLRTADDNLFRALGANPIMNVDPTGMKELPQKDVLSFEPVTIIGTVAQTSEQAAEKKQGATDPTQKAFWEQTRSNQALEEGLAIAHKERDKGSKIALTAWAAMGTLIVSGVTGGLATHWVLSGLVGTEAAVAGTAPLATKIIAGGAGGLVSSAVEVGAEQGLRTAAGEETLTWDDFKMRLQLGAALGAAGPVLAKAVVSASGRSMAAFRQFTRTVKRATTRTLDRTLDALRRSMTEPMFHLVGRMKDLVREAEERVAKVYARRLQSELGVEMDRVLGSGAVSDMETDAKAIVAALEVVVERNPHLQERWTALARALRQLKKAKQGLETARAVNETVTRRTP